MFILVCLAILYLNIDIEDSNNRNLLWIALGCISLAMIISLFQARSKTLASNRVKSGQLTITNLAIEGLASEHKRNDIDIFVNLIITRIPISSIDGASADTDGVF